MPISGQHQRSRMRRTPDARKQAIAQVIRLCLTHEQTLPIWFMPLRCVK
jgi:hypothetical protein